MLRPGESRPQAAPGPALLAAVYSLLSNRAIATLYAPQAPSTRDYPFLP